MINQARNEIVIYDIDELGGLSLATSQLKNVGLVSPNSIIAVGPNAFYVSNSRAGGLSGFGSTVDFMRRAANGSVHYYDGNSWSIAATGLRFANGLAVSADGTRLYVAETSAKSVVTFQRDVSTGALTRLSETALDSFPDNLTMLADDQLLIATLPKPLAFSAHVDDETKLAPSRILKKSAFKNGLGENTDVIFQSNGEELSAANNCSTNWQ